MYKIVTSFTLLFVLIVSLFLLNNLGARITEIEIEKTVRIIINIAAGVGIILWAWMFIDLISKDMRYKKTWIASLLFFNVLAAVAYLLFIFFPYERKRTLLKK